MSRDHLGALVTRARIAARMGRAREPETGRLCGALSCRESVRAGQASVGEGTYGNPVMHFGPGEQTRVEVGSYCSFATGVEILAGGEHRTDWVSTYPFRVRWGLEGLYEDGHPRPAGDIVIGNDVWVGAGALILSGVRIGDGAVVGANAVVASSVRPYAVVVGNPAREIRRRFTDDQVQALMRIAWWDWPEPKVREVVGELNGGSVEEFIAAHDPGPGA